MVPRELASLCAWRRVGVNGQEKNCFFDSHAFLSYTKTFLGEKKAQKVIISQRVSACEIPG